MINRLWLFLITTGIVVAALNGKMDSVSQGIFQGAIQSVELIINLLGPMAIWLGLMKVARASGLINGLSKIFRPIFRFIFPEIPADHPAFGTIILNLTANLLGLGNSATPLGIEAMKELQTLNKEPFKASYAMCTLLALNTSSITIIPATIISLRAASGSDYPSIILVSTLFATTISTITALLFDKFFRLFSLGDY